MSDTPSLAAEVYIPESEQEGAEVGAKNPSVLAALASAESTNQSVPIPCDPSLPDPDAGEEAAHELDDRTEMGQVLADQEHEIDEVTGEVSAQATTFCEPVLQLPFSEGASATASRIVPNESLAADAISDQSPKQTRSAGGAVDPALTTVPVANHDTGLDDDQTIEESEGVSSCDTAEALNYVTKKTGEASADQNREKQKRQISDRSREVPKYRPRLRSLSARTPFRSDAESSQPPDSLAGTLEATYLITFLPGGWDLEVSVLLSRKEGMPDKLKILAGGQAYQLFAIDENLFEPIQPSNEFNFAEGFSAETEGDPVHRWVRSARDLHAFSPRPGVSGFATVPRVLIGQENVILCRSAAVPTVQRCASATGSDPLVEVRGPGIPDGWSCFRGYRPTHPADFADLDDIFLALNPLPDASIDLSGGIASGRGTWMFGFPPVVRVLGSIPSPGELTIDGNLALESSDRGWIAPGWDTLGTHTVRFAGLSRTYEIISIDQDWHSWVTASEAAFSVCGARVSAETGLQALAISGGPYWLVGPSAGDLAFARRSYGGASIAAPSFLPVWALPSIGPGPRSSAMALAHSIPPKPPSTSRSRNEILSWCQLVRAAGVPTGVDERNLWRQYRKYARSLRRKWR